MKTVLAILIVLASSSLTAASTVFHVSTSGTDTNPGTSEQPFATFAAAQDAARKAGPGPHEIRVHNGDYFLSEPLALTAEDNGLSIVGEDRAKVRARGQGRKMGFPGAPGEWSSRCEVEMAQQQGQARAPWEMGSAASAYACRLLGAEAHSGGADRHALQTG